MAEVMKSEFDKVQSVDIDESGIFKYVLIEVTAKKGDDKANKVIVRGYQRCEWHADIHKPLQRELDKKGLVTYCKGGGFIEHRPGQKKLKIYGESQAYGRADHNEARNLLLEKYKDYEIFCDDD